MRFIIHQLPYERPIVAGELLYERDGAATGAVEQYRVSAAVDGYWFLRVDLDARNAPSGRSTLYHLTLNPDGRPEQLKYRFWGDGLEIAGAVVWDGAQLTAMREVNGVGYQDEATAGAFWFPSGAGLALLAPHTGMGSVPAVTMDQNTADPHRAMALKAIEVSVESLDSETITLNDHETTATGIDIMWVDERRHVWLHEDGWPLRIWRDDGLSAHCKQLVVYQ